MESRTLTLELDMGGRPFSIETGRMAKQADGSALVRLGDTVVLVTACADRKPREGVDFLPLTVDYREYTYAAGRIPGGFFKREGRPTEKEILTSRLIDRPLRPLFPQGWRSETQVVAMVLSHDQENDPDVLALTGASTALALSNIPFEHTLAAVRVAHRNGSFVANPTFAQLEDSELNLIVAGSSRAIVMVEAGAQEVSESMMLDAILFGHEQIRRIIAVQEKLRETLQPVKRTVEPPEVDPAIRERVAARIGGELPDLLSHPVKKDRDLKIREYADTIVAEMEDLDDAQKAQAKRAFNDIKEHTIRQWILEQRRRPDGRRFDEVRSVSCALGVLPRTHGSALFTRGETQALVNATLGTSSDTQKIEALEGEDERRFLLHYNFPPFSVGEVKFLRGPGRREIGHGALAHRALERILPSEEDQFPYTIRLVSDILESNGSSSMASVCGGSLALMDAGVPVKAPVAGVAMGLVKEGSNYAILTDIAGFEDHYGDMDFKVAGTASGITALQMDIKIEGITEEILKEALQQALQGRLHILEIMGQTIAEARPEISVYAPRILTIEIPKEKIRDVIGPGGKVVRSIVERTGAKIDIKDDGSIDIASTDEAAAKMAREIIEEIIAEAEVGKTYLGRVQRLTDFGAFVEILPGTDGLLHISEVSEHHIRRIEDVLEEGQELLVKVISIDPQGRVRLSRKAVLRDQGIVEEPPPDTGDRPPRDDRPPRGDGRRPGGPPGGRGGRGPRRDRDRRR